MHPSSVGNIPAVLPDYVRIHGGPSKVDVSELAEMAILRGLKRRVQGLKHSGRPVILMDQGPIFMLARLKAVGSPAFRSPSADAWRKKAFRHWASLVDYVVWLDTAETVLLARVLERDRWHVLQDAARQDVGDWMQSYREAFSEIIAGLGATGERPHTLRFDCGPESIEGLWKVVRDELLESIDSSNAQASEANRSGESQLP